MRTILILLLVSVVGLAGATFKDPRKLHPVAPLSQDEVARQQALQRQQQELGGVPGKTDQTGYSSSDRSSPDAAAVIAGHASASDGAGTAGQDLKENAEAMSSEAQKPKKTIFGAIWALLGGLVLAVGAWAGLQKYGPKPPAHLRA